LRYYCFITVK